MAQVESRLWWYRALHQLTVDALAAHLRGRNAVIVDAGCGTGGLLVFLRERGYQNCLGFDASPHAVAVCQERGLPVQLCDLRQMEQLPFPQSSDAIVSNDTLYFFTPAEREGILKLFAKHLSSGGLLILNVPALRAFRGIHDMSVGIGHRFSKAEMEALLNSAGFIPVRIRFWPFLLSPLIYAKRLSQRIRLRHSSRVPVRSDIDLPPAAVNWLFESITKMENAFLSWKPFGSSLFVVARKLP